VVASSATVLVPYPDVPPSEYERSNVNQMQSIARNRLHLTAYFRLLR
jgi:hypothetical protein